MDALEAKLSFTKNCFTDEHRDADDDLSLRTVSGNQRSGLFHKRASFVRHCASQQGFSSGSRGQRRQTFGGVKLQRKAKTASQIKLARGYEFKVRETLTQQAPGSVRDTKSSLANNKQNASELFTSQVTRSHFLDVGVKK